MSKLFDGAKFGDKFVTRGGELAIYRVKAVNHHLVLERGFIEVDDNGRCAHYYSDCKEFDIVSRYKEDKV